MAVDIYLPGPKIPFYAPFQCSQAAEDDEFAAPLDKVFARVLCKDAIGLWLGWIPAPYRASRFKDGPSPGTASNAGRNFAINEKVAANPFKFSLYPGTKIAGQRMNYSTGVVSTEKEYLVKSISVWMPGHVTVLQVLAWVNGNLRRYTRRQGGESPELPALPDKYSAAQIEQHMEAIMAVTTPNERKYNVRTPMLRKARPIILPGSAQAPPVEPDGQT